MPTKKNVKPVKKAVAKSDAPARKKAVAVKKASPAPTAKASPAPSVKKAKPAKPAAKKKIAGKGDPTLLQRIAAPILNLIHPVKKGKKKGTV
ncbi:MAG: hypothetical protein ABIO46_15860 [Chitinophagales bacterium]